MTDAQKEIHKKEVESTDRAERTSSRRVYTPAVDIIERKDDIVLIADMPGVNKKSADITLEKNVLTIKGSVDAVIPADHRLSVSEYGIGDYERTFTLSDEVDRERIQATVSNGVLKLVLPKAEAMKTRKITVRAEA